MITQSLNIHPKHAYIALHNHRCLTILLRCQKLISPFFGINETYENVNYLHLVYCHHLYMNEIIIILLLDRSTEFGKYSAAITSIDNCLFTPQS